jgi:hypothetical protein
MYILNPLILTFFFLHANTSILSFLHYFMLKRCMSWNKTYHTWQWHAVKLLAKYFLTAQKWLTKYKFILHRFICTINSFLFSLPMIQDSSVSVTIGWMMGFNSWQWHNFSLHCYVQTRLGPHPASYAMDMGGTFPRDIPDCSPQSSAKITRAWVCNGTPHPPQKLLRNKNVFICLYFN